MKEGKAGGVEEGERNIDLMFYLLMHSLVDSFFLKDFIWLFLESGEGRAKGREILISCLSNTPN